MLDFCHEAADLSRFFAVATVMNETDYDNNAGEELKFHDDDIQWGSHDGDVQWGSHDEDIKQEYHNEDIQQVYHPNACRDPEVFSFDTYQSTLPVVVPPAEPEPWLPFKMREDFEFTEITLATVMTKAQINATIDLLHKCIDKGKGSFTLSSHNEMRQTLKVALERLPKVCLGLLHCYIYAP